MGTNYFLIGYETSKIRTYRRVKKLLQNIAKEDPGRARQNKLARSVIKFSQPRTNILPFNLEWNGFLNQSKLALK